MKKVKKNILYSWIEIPNIEKLSNFYKFIYRLKAKPIKLPESIFIDTNLL